MGKLVKSCVQAPEGWLFVALDYASLEDRINTLLTQDPNKRKVYTDGYCGHSLRAYSYFSDQMPDIEQALPDERCFIANTPNGDIYFKASDTINYQNKTYTGEEFYEICSRL